MLTIALMLMAGADPATAARPEPDILVVGRGAESYPGVRVPDAELGDLRGGFRLPNGIDVNMVVQSETSLDGALLLRSVYRLDSGAPQLSVFAPAPGQRIETGRAPTAGTGGGAVQVLFDRSNGVVFVPGGGGGGVVVNSGGAAGQAARPDDGLAGLDLSNGAVDTAGGTVRLIENGAQRQAVLNGQDIDVRHLFGQGVGTVISNMGNDRMIDTATTVSLDLSGATPMNLGSAMLRVESLASDIGRGLVR